MKRLIRLSKPYIGLREQLAVQRVLASNRLAQGREVEAFESEFSVFLTSGHSVAVNSGTSALHLSLLALGIGPGDEVIVPGFSFAATSNAVVMTGAKAVFADIDPISFNLSPMATRKVVTPRTKAVIAVHLYGNPADVGELRKVCKEFNLFFLEDAAQAHGAIIGDRPVGTFGDMAAFSFYATKNMTSGEGGMIVTGSEREERTVRMLRNQGMISRYQHEIPGLNNRMTDIHATIGRVQLSRIRKWNEKRIKNASVLNSAIDGVPKPSVQKGSRHVYHQYTIRVPDDRDGFIKNLRNNWQIETGIHYPYTLGQINNSKEKSSAHMLSECDRASREVVSLPVHPFLSRRDLDRICTAVNVSIRAGS